MKRFFRWLSGHPPEMSRHAGADRFSCHIEGFYTPEGPEVIRGNVTWTFKSERPAKQLAELAVLTTLFAKERARVEGYLQTR